MLKIFNFGTKSDLYSFSANYSTNKGLTLFQFSLVQKLEIFGTSQEYVSWNRNNFLKNYFCIGGKITDWCQFFLNY